MLIKQTLQYVITQEAGLKMQLFFPGCFSLVSVPTGQSLNSYMGMEQYSSKTQSFHASY